MKFTIVRISAGLAVIAGSLYGGSAYAANTSASATTSTTASTSSSSTSTATSAQASTSTTSKGTRLADIISKGDAEISRRLASLATLSAKINAASKLNANNKAALTNEVTTTVAGLTTLKATLDAETSATAALTDAKSIVSEYRVYALVTPKVGLIKTADDQQAAEAKLSALATKLQSRLQTAAQKGDDVTAEQAKLADMQAQVSASTAISSAIESSVIGLQPTDYNNDHTILSGDSAKLKTAHADNVAALADAKAIIAGLEKL